MKNIFAASFFTHFYSILFTMYKGNCHEDMGLFYGKMEINMMDIG